MCDHIDSLREGSYIDSDNPPLAAVSQQMILPPTLDRKELRLLFVRGPRLSGRKGSESLCFPGAAAG